MATLCAALTTLAWQGCQVPLTRRSAFAAAGLAVVTACTSRERSAPAPAVDPDDALRSSAVAREQALLVAYDDALAAAPALAARIAPLRAEHATHLAALLGPTSSPSPAPSAPTPSTPTSSTPSQAPGSLLLGLVVLERATASAHASAALTASRRLAPVLASLAACEASHVVVL